MLQVCSFPAYIGNADMIQPDLAPLQPSLDDMEISGKRAPDNQWHRKNSVLWGGGSAQLPAPGAEPWWVRKSRPRGCETISVCLQPEEG